MVKYINKFVDVLVGVFLCLVLNLIGRITERAMMISTRRMHIETIMMIDKREHLEQKSYLKTINMNAEG